MATARTTQREISDMKDIGKGKAAPAASGPKNGLQKGYEVVGDNGSSPRAVSPTNRGNKKGNKNA